MKKNIAAAELVSVGPARSVMAESPQMDSPSLLPVTGAEPVSKKGRVGWSQLRPNPHHTPFGVCVSISSLTKDAVLCV